MGDEHLFGGYICNCVLHTRTVQCKDCAALTPSFSFSFLHPPLNPSSLRAALKEEEEAPAAAEGEGAMEADQPAAAGEGGGAAAEGEGQQPAGGEGEGEGPAPMED